MGRYSKVLVWCFALSAGMLASVSSLSAITKDRNPSAAILLWPENGFALAKFNSMRIADFYQNGGAHKNLKKMSQSQLQVIEEEAKRSLLSEPTAEEAAVALALVYEANDQLADASLLMKFVGNMTKRNATNSLWLINEAAQSKDASRILEYYDRVLKTNRAARPIMFQQLSAAMENDIFITPMKELLKKDPSWQEGFWDAILKNKLAFENGAKLRVELASSGRKDVGRLDRALVTNLVRAKQFHSAYSLYASLADPRVLEMHKSNLSNFSQQPVMPPFDWQLTQTGGFGARINSNGKTLELSSLDNGAGRFGRKLIRLESNVYRLDILYDEQQPIDKIQLSLSCAEKSHYSEKISRIALGNSKAIHLDLSTNKCRWYFLEIVGNYLDDDNSGYDLVISKIQFVISKIPLEI